MNVFLNLICVCALALAPAADARTKRSQSAKVEFKLSHPCPADGATTGPCKGYVIDHRIGLCVGGPDTAQNMRWMTVETAKSKDRWECKSGWEGKLHECEEKGCFVM